jgi:hypothetical protein
MTETYTFLNKGRIDPDNFFENDYVTYTTPSREDKDWELVFYPHQYPHRDRPTHYFRCWKFIDDETAREEYPIFRALAMKRNWEPMDEIPPASDDPCPHTTTTLMGHSSITRQPVYKCTQCHRMVFHDRRPVTPGVYEITRAEYERISMRLFDAYPKLQNRFKS